jgi:hypothetical protein
LRRAEDAEIPDRHRTSGPDLRMGSELREAEAFPLKEAKCGFEPRRSHQTKQCRACLATKPLADFCKNRDKVFGVQDYCRICQHGMNARHYASSAKTRAAIRAFNKKAWAARRAFVTNYLAAHPCVDCGEADVVVLDFDHVRGEKVGVVSVLIRKGSLSAIKAEIEKCEVRCANCHRRVTHRRRTMGS